MGLFHYGEIQSEEALRPVRSLTSSVLRWPERSEVEAAVQAWASSATERHPELLRLGVFGSYARRDAGVGSDLDLVAVVESSERLFERRGAEWDLTELPVPAERTGRYSRK